MLKEVAKLLHMLSGDACISSVFPFEGNLYITRACAAISTNNLQLHIMNKLKEYNKEVVHLLYRSQIHECVDVITCFMLCIISDIDEIHHDNRPAEQAQPIPGSYYPPGGIAYYFSPSGEQLHKMPDFTVNGTSSQPNYDDIPLVDLCVRRSFQMYHMVAMGICLYGSAPNMATHMASTSSTKLKGAGIHFVHCTSFWSICQNIFFMISHAPFQNMHSTGHQSC